MLDAMLLTRPYSWLDAVFIGLIGLVSTRSQVPATRHVIVALVCLMLWWSLNWVSERLQANAGRTPTSWLMALLPGGFASALVLGLAGWGAWLPLVATWALLFLYPFKARIRWIGPLGPLIRGAHTVSFLYVGAALSGHNADAVVLSVGLALVQVSRSLVADIRDIATDTFELPRLIGAHWSKWAAAIVLSGAIAVLADAGAPWSMLAILAVQALCIALTPSSLSFEVHITFVALFTIAKAVLYADLGNLGVAPVAIAASLQVFLIATYLGVPRRSNRDFEARVQRVVAAANRRIG